MCLVPFSPSLPFPSSSLPPLPSILFRPLPPSRDKSWAFHDASSGQCLAHVMDPAVADSFECLAFHPDGVLLGEDAEGEEGEKAGRRASGV